MLYTVSYNFQSLEDLAKLVIKLQSLLKNSDHHLGIILNNHDYKDSIWVHELPSDQDALLIILEKLLARAAKMHELTFYDTTDLAGVCAQAKGVARDIQQVQEEETFKMYFCGILIPMTLDTTLETVREELLKQLSYQEYPEERVQIKMPPHEVLDVGDSDRAWLALTVQKLTNKEVVIPDLEREGGGLIIDENTSVEELTKEFGK